MHIPRWPAVLLLAASLPFGGGVPPLLREQHAVTSLVSVPEGAGMHSGTASRKGTEELIVKGETLCWLVGVMMVGAAAAWLLQSRRCKRPAFVGSEPGAFTEQGAAQLSDPPMNFSNSDLPGCSHMASTQVLRSSDLMELIMWHMIAAPRTCPPPGTGNQSKNWRWGRVQHQYARVLAPPSAAGLVCREWKIFWGRMLAERRPLQLTRSFSQVAVSVFGTHL